MADTPSIKYLGQAFVDDRWKKGFAISLVCTLFKIWRIEWLNDTRFGIRNCIWCEVESSAKIVLTISWNSKVLISSVTTPIVKILHESKDLTTKVFNKKNSDMYNIDKNIWAFLIQLIHILHFSLEVECYCPVFNQIPTDAHGKQLWKKCLFDQH